MLTTRSLRDRQDWLRSILRLVTVARLTRQHLKS